VAAGAAAFAPDAWIRIGTDDTVTVIVDRQVSDRCHVGQAVRLTRHGGMLG